MDCMDAEGEIAMFFFNNDYAEGCHPRVLEALVTARTSTVPEQRRRFVRYAAVRMLMSIFWLAVHKPTSP